MEGNSTEAKSLLEAQRFLIPPGISGKIHRQIQGITASKCGISSIVKITSDRKSNVLLAKPRTGGVCENGRLNHLVRGTGP